MESVSSIGPTLLFEGALSLLKNALGVRFRSRSGTKHTAFTHSDE
jgi:hypothetical protein